MKQLRKLTEQEYFDLQGQYDKTPALEDSFGATGEHMILRKMLRDMGYSLRESRRGAELELADELLTMGYDHDTHEFQYN
jgi:hypothetical protein